MNLEQVHKVYFVGIGGIGMSALARYFVSIGKDVAGYDRTETLLTRDLANEGMNIHYSDDVNLIPEAFQNSRNTLVVYTPAVSFDHKELSFFQSNGFEIKKRAEVLGIISRSQDVLAIAGTHGKTTTSTMVSHLLKNSPVDCNAFLGGISLNYQSNLLLSKKSRVVVVEADEYDRSFLHLNPKAAIITSMDADHLDIYGNYSEYSRAFEQFMEGVKPGGFVIIKKGVDVKVPEHVQRFSYSLHGPSDFYADNITIRNGFYVYDLVTPDRTLKGIKLGFPGLLNVENSVAAIAMASLLQVDENSVKNAMEGFRGVKRRFEYHIKDDKVIFIDDYGHHPEELRFTIQSVKEMFPGKKVTGIFQPHLYSRTRDFAGDFAMSLSLLDRLILLDIYPAREKPIPGVSSEIIFKDVQTSDKYLCKKTELIDLINKLPLPEVIITMGAGDIDNFIGPIKEILLKKERS